MATRHADWTVEQLNSGDVTLEITDDAAVDAVMRLSREEETVELLVDGGIAEAVDVDEPPEWVQNVAARLGIYEVR